MAKSSSQSSFDFLSEIEEDINSLEDEKLFHLESSNEIANKKKLKADSQ